jgi:single-strand DNA-binding protein
MNDSTITISGNVATDVRHVRTDTGVDITSFRLASSPRRLQGGRWVDGPTSYLTVTCWRFLAQNAAAALKKGDPVVVTGTLRVREWETEGRNGVSTEVDARVIGHDLNRGITQFQRVTRTRPVTAEEEQAMRLSTGFADGDVGGSSAGTAVASPPAAAQDEDEDELFDEDSGEAA